MSRRFPLLTLLLAAITLGGCVHYAWVKPGGDPSTFQADHYACLSNSTQTAPPVYGAYARPDVVSVDTRCRPDPWTHDMICRDVVRQRPSGPPIVTDLNASARGDLYTACMNAHGWFYQAVQDPPQ